MSWLHIWDLWKTRWQWLWKWICTTKIKNACGTGKLVFVISCLNTWLRVSGWNYSKESLHPWKKLCWRHGKRTIWKCVWSHRWCEDIVLCGTDACWFQNWLKIGEENEKIEVIRWQFPLLHGMLRAAYSAQGLTLDGGVLVDLRRAGGLEDDDWWLAIYVMLTRARKLENLILLGMTDQVEDLLRRGPPAYLRELTDKLEAKGAATLERLQNWPVYESLKTSWHLTLHLHSNRLSAERSVGIEMVRTLWRSTDMFDALCLSYWYVWQGVSGHDFGMFGAENAFVIPTICDLSMCCCCNYSFWTLLQGVCCHVWCLIIYICLTGGILTWFGCLVHRMLLMVHCKHLWFEHLMLTLLQEVYCHVWCLFIDICLPGGVLTWFGMFRLRLWHDLTWFGMICARCYTEGRAGHNKSTQSPENKCEGFLHGSLSRVGK